MREGRAGVKDLGARSGALLPVSRSASMTSGQVSGVGEVPSGDEMSVIPKVSDEPLYSSTPLLIYMYLPLLFFTEDCRGIKDLEHKASPNFHHEQCRAGLQGIVGT